MSKIFFYLIRTFMSLSWIVIVFTQYLRSGLIVIPGLGRVDRLKTVVHNLVILKPLLSHKSHRAWDCIVFIYAERNDDNDVFWRESNDLTFIKSLCNIVENPNKLVAENLRYIVPALITAQYEFIFILLDDCKLPSGNKEFDLEAITHIMQFNNMTVASPLVIGANKGGGQAFRQIMQRPAPVEYAGHTSSFVEIFAWILTVPAYTALWELLCPHVNPYAWGYDIWYDRWARRRVKGHKMGVISTARVFHEQNMSASGGGRTDSTDMKIKWTAMKAQEKYFSDRLGTRLHSFRMSNRSWNGVATGFVFYPLGYDVVDFKNL